MVLTEIRREFKKGEDADDSAHDIITGGEVYQAGGSITLGKYYPKFHRVKALQGKPVKQICTGVHDCLCVCLAC